MTPEFQALQEKYPDIAKAVLAELTDTTRSLYLEVKALGYEVQRLRNDVNVFITVQDKSAEDLIEAKGEEEEELEEDIDPNYINEVC